MKRKDKAKRKEEELLESSDPSSEEEEAAGCDETDLTPAQKVPVLPKTTLEK